MKRNVRTATASNKSRAMNRPTHILQKYDTANSLHSYKDNSTKEIMDTTTHMLVMNEDMIAEIMAKLSSLDDSVIHNQTDATLRNFSGFDTSDDQMGSTALPVEELLNLSMSQFNSHNASANQNAFKNKILRQESEDSYNRIKDPKSSLPAAYNVRVLDTEYSHYARNTKQDRPLAYGNAGFSRGVHNGKLVKNKKRPVTTHAYRAKYASQGFNNSKINKNTSFYGSAVSTNAKYV